MSPPNPTATAEWALACLFARHVPQARGKVTVGWMCENCAESYARQQVEIERSRWISDQCTANQAGHAMGRIEGYTEGWNAALERAAMIARSTPCPSCGNHGHEHDTRLKLEIAAAIRALEP